MSSNKRIKVYLDEANEWRWTYWASSDKVATSGEGYRTRGHAMEMVASLYPGVPVEVVAAEENVAEGEGE